MTRGTRSGFAAPPASRPTSSAEKVDADPDPRPPGRSGSASIGVAFRGPLDLWPARGKTPDEAPRPLAGPPDKVAADIRAYQAAGVDTMIFDFPRPDPAAMIAAMRRVARELRPRLARRSAARAR